jgi:mannan endo-1,4-beta-mannosidase
LLIRTTVVIGIIAAIAASLNRVGQHPTAGDGAGQTASAVTGQIVPGQATTTAPVVPPPAGSGAASSATAGQATGPAAAPCRVSYNVTLDSATQYTVVLSVANTGTSKVGGWVLRWQYPTTQKVLYGWNAMVTNGPNGIAASGIGQGQTIAPGHHVTIGFVGERGQQVPTPTGFTLNGQACQSQPLQGNATAGTGA